MRTGDRSVLATAVPRRAPSSVDVPPAVNQEVGGAFTRSQYKLLLTAMMARGYGLQALCLFLSMTRDALFDLIVECDLPTPADRPLRKVGGRHAWQASEFPVFLRGWLEGWSAGCIAHQLNRSKGGIWSKARRLGLPKRARRSLHWPTHLEPPKQGEVDVPQPSSAGAAKFPPKWLVKGTDTHLELTSQRGGKEVAWASNTQALIEIGLRAWAGQRIGRIAADYGVSYRTITSQLHWLEVKARPRSEQVDHFDRRLGEERMNAEGYKVGYTKSDNRFPYFYHRRSWTRSRRDVKVGWYDVGYA